MTDTRKLNLLYYNTFLKCRDIVTNAAIPIDISVSYADDINEVMKHIMSSNNTDMLFIDYDGSAAVIDLVSAVHKYDEDLLIYFITDIDNDEEKIKAYNTGVIDYFILPLSSQVLQALLKNMACLRGSRLKLHNKTNILQYEVEQAVRTVKERELESLLLLGRASEYKDKDTASHILRVGKYSAMIMESLGGSNEDKELMLYSAPLHDVGKIGIADNILNKSSKLTEEEYSIMKTHTTKGYEILSGTKSKYLEACAIIALSHHEKYDGSGYPNGLKGDSIPLYGRIVAVADVFDALISQRVYKNSWTLEQTVEYLKSQSGIHFDPIIVEKFLAKIDEAEDIFKSLMPEK